MKIIILTALGSILIMSAADAAQKYRHMGGPVTTCDNNGHCTNFKSIAPRSVSGKTRRRARVNRMPALDANGNIAGTLISHKTGARARVGRAYASRFQAYIDDLENNYGAKVLFMGGIRRGRCSIYSEHPCGKALDVCQLRRGVVDPRCHLPRRRKLGRIAASHGLFEGGRWCNSDYGHAQVGVTAPACGKSRPRIVRQ